MGKRPKVVMGDTSCVSTCALGHVFVFTEVQRRRGRGEAERIGSSGYVPSENVVYTNLSGVLVSEYTRTFYFTNPRLSH